MASELLSALPAMAVEPSTATFNAAATGRWEASLSLLRRAAQVALKANGKTKKAKKRVLKEI